MARSTVALAMMVHNEADCLPIIWENLKDRLDAAVIIVHPEYEDDSEAVARKLFGHLPGEILAIDHPQPMSGSKSRNQVIDMAREYADYVLWLDPDSPMFGDIPEELHAPLYSFTTTNGGMAWQFVHLLRSDVPVKWIGRVHEVIDTGTWPVTCLGTVAISRAASGGGAERQRQWDAPALLEDVADDPLNPRWPFYLAQTYRDIDENDLAIAWYEHRARMTGFVEETFISMYQLGRLLMGRDNEKAEYWLLKAHAYRPTRHEPLVQLAWMYDQSGQRHMAETIKFLVNSMPYPSDALFVEAKPRL